MNTKNYEFLKEGLKYLGFGDKLNEELQKQIEKQPTEFQLKMEGVYKRGSGNEKVSFTLDFKKSDQTDMYFFNRHTATLLNEDPEKNKSQAFYITKNAGITAKEAFNLLDGRSVNKELTTKEGQPFNAWLQLDFNEKDKHDNFKVKQYHSGYGYDLDKVLERFPIKELGTAEQREQLIKSLSKGNLTPVTFTKEGREEKMFVEASPQFKTLQVYDESLKKQFQENTVKAAREPVDTPEKKEATKKELRVDDQSGPQKKSKRKGLSV